MIFVRSIKVDTIENVKPFIFELFFIIGKTISKAMINSFQKQFLNQ